jgi:inorganic pyrophosphatase
MTYQAKPVGIVGSREFRVFFGKDGLLVSPFHDVPLWADKEKGIANMVVEIPKGSQPKLEISRNEPLNPIKQDEKKGKLRVVAIPYPFNYGAFPQTWEYPVVKDADTGFVGDNDPIDVCEIGSVTRKTGDVVQVKILGTYAMIDEGETDWKILVIDVNDPLAANLNAHSDIPKEVTDKVFTFLRDYKIPDGNPPNNFGFNNQLCDRKLALQKVNETHEHWSNLISGKVPNKTEKYDQSILNTTLDPKFAKSVISPSEAEQLAIGVFKNFLHAKQ